MTKPSYHCDTITMMEVIERYVAEHAPVTRSAICDALGIKRSAGGELLRKMRIEGRVRRVPNMSGSRLLMSHEWEIGEDPNLDHDAAGTPVRRIIPASKAPVVGQRDPLVSSLFGERGTVKSRQANEPRCIACRAPEGEPHGALCILALFDLVPGGRATIADEVMA